MATDELGHTTPAADDAPARQALLDLSLSIRDAYPVANVTARAQLLVDLAALPNPIVPSVSRPILVTRADATAGMEYEYTVDGTNWRCFTGSTFSWTNVTPVAGWGAPTAYQLPAFGLAGGFGHVLGGRIELKSGSVVFNAGADVSVVASLAIAPTRTIEMAGHLHNSGTVPILSRVTLLVSTGQILVRSSTTFTMAASTSSYVTIPPMSWPQV